MQLLRKRTFGDYFNDTFGFIRENGKHYFKNYFILCGIPIAIMILIGFFVATSVYSLSSFRGGFGQVIENYMHNNLILFIFIAILFSIVAIIFSIIQYTYNPAYLILYQQRGSDFTHKDILRFIFKEKIKKIIIFFLFSMLISIPVYILVGLVALVFLITIVGVFIPIAGVTLWYSMALMAYLKDDKRVGESFSYAWNLMFHKFWKNVGAVAIFMLMVLLINWGFNMIMSLFSSLATLGSDNNAGSILAVIILVGTTALTQMVSFFLQVFLQLMQGIVFFSLVEDTENEASIEEIDKIGLGE